MGAAAFLSPHLSSSSGVVLLFPSFFCVVLFSVLFPCGWAFFLLSNSVTLLISIFRRNGSSTARRLSRLLYFVFSFLFNFGPMSGLLPTLVGSKIEFLPQKRIKFRTSCWPFFFSSVFAVMFSVSDFHLPCFHVAPYLRLCFLMISFPFPFLWWLVRPPPCGWCCFLPPAPLWAGLLWVVLPSRPALVWCCFPLVCGAAFSSLLLGVLLLLLNAAYFIPLPCGWCCPLLPFWCGAAFPSPPLDGAAFSSLVGVVPVAPLRGCCLSPLSSCIMV